MTNSLLEIIRRKYNSSVMNRAQKIVKDLREQLRVPVPDLTVEFSQDFDSLHSIARISAQTLYIDIHKTVNQRSLLEYYETKCYLPIVLETGEKYRIKTTIGKLDSIFGEAKIFKSVIEDNHLFRAEDIDRELIVCIVNYAISECDTWLNRVPYVKEGLALSCAHALLKTEPEIVVENEWTKDSSQRVAGLLLGEVVYYGFGVVVDALNRSGYPSGGLLSKEYLLSVNI